MRDDDLSDVIIPSHPCPPARCSREEWEAEASTLDHLKGNWSSIGLLAAEARCEFHMAQLEPKAHVGRHRGSEAITALAANGASFEEIARIVGVSIREIAGRFTLDHKDIEGFIEADRILAVEGAPESYVELAERSGITYQQAQYLCARLGHVSKTQERVAAGGGLKFTEEAYGQIRAMREAGKTPSEIGKALNMKRNTVAVLCRRRGWAPIVAEAVAS